MLRLLVYIALAVILIGFAMIWLDKDDRVYYPNNSIEWVDDRV